LDPVGQPHRDPLAALQAGGIEISGHNIDRALQLSPGEPACGIAQGRGLRALGRMLPHERVEGVVSPQALRVIAPRRSRCVQGEKGICHPSSCIRAHRPGKVASSTKGRHTMLQDLMPYAERIAEKLKARKETVSVGESSTAGLISAALLAVPGASAYFIGGAVVDTRVSRTQLVRVSEEELAPPKDITPATAHHALLFPHQTIDALAPT